MRSFIPVFVSGALLATAASAWATGGRLNADGCHNSKKAGYHCHRSQSDKKATKSTGKATGASGAASATKPTSKP